MNGSVNGAGHGAEMLKGWQVALIVGGFIAFLIAGGKYVSTLGVRSPCATLEKSNYERRFYVYLSPSGDETKAYHVPALISTHIEGNGDEPQYYCHEMIYAVMPNGGTITFEDGLLHCLEPGNREGPVGDKQGREWSVELTCDPAD